MTGQDDLGERASTIKSQLETVQARIDAATTGSQVVRLLPVSKGHDDLAVRAVASLGVGALGESYAQELKSKAELLAAEGVDMQWHFIGQLQTNKVRLVGHAVHTWQSVDRVKVAREIAKRAPGARAYAQVNLSADPGKAGCGFDQLDDLVAEMRDLGLSVDGLMGVGTADDDVETARGFERLRSATDRLNLAECSMGMTADLELAIAAGSTMVRVGTDVFGPRG